MRKAACLSAILSLLLAAPLALEAAHLTSVNSTNDGSGNGPSRRSTASDLDALDTNGAVQDIFEQRICSGFLVDRQDDADAASPGTPVCVAVGGGCTLRAAVDAANANGGGLICLPAGTYPLTLGTDLFVSGNVTIDGDGSSDTIIDGLKKTQIFDLAAKGPVSISNIQLNNGFSNGDGGAVIVRGGTAANFTFVTFNGNACSDGSGGAMKAYSGSTLTLNGVDFNNNLSRFVSGGAIACDGLLTLNASRFNGNQVSGEGGAILLTDSQVAGNANTITDAEFYGNKAGLSGGGLSIDVNAQLALANVTLGANDSPQGSGLSNAGTVTVTDSTISGNVNGAGPGIGFGNGTVGTATLTNCTITGNSSSVAGYEIDHTGTSLKILNSVVNGGPLRNCSFRVQSLGNNIESGSTCGLNGTGDISKTDAKLGPLQYTGGFEQTHVLLPSSPAIDAGTNKGCPPFDQRGVARPQGARCDMGSVEMIATADLQVTKSGPARIQLGQSIAYTVSVRNAGPSDAAAVVVSDTTPPGLTFVSNTGACVSAFPCNLGTVVNGQTRTITSTYLVPGGYKGPSTISNTASASLSTTDPVPQNNSSTASTLVMSALPSLSIGSVVVVKPASGTVAAVFPVTMSSASALDVLVSYATSDNTAHAGSDYQAVSAVLVIPSGAMSSSITVLVNGNTIASDDKAFTVFLFGPSNAVIGTGAGAGTGLIQDRTPFPSLSIGDVTVTPGGSGTTPAGFPVTLSAATSRTVSVNYSTADGTATAGNNDYLSTSGTLFFAPGETSKTITVPVVGKPLLAPSNFFVDLSPAVNATVARSRGTASISRAFPSLSVGDAAVQSPGTGSGSAVFSVNLSVASTETITVSFTTADRTAFAGIDYTATSGVLTFAPGETAKSVTVPILPGGTVFPTKVFQLILSNSTGAILAKSLGEAAIFDRSKSL
ncbi:MAG TPA: Calx-beta domain-containing protein, partial [Thermoanaerobaculia bacterium]|nr:Calx-beta domain-containing protein [Thermoanaerobaculia bacterium]